MANHRRILAVACCGAWIYAALAPCVAAQSPTSTSTQPTPQRTPPQPVSPANPAEGVTGKSAPKTFDDPAAAYSAGRYDQALQGFVDAQVEHPEDPAVLMNLGSAHYKMRDFDQAQTAFAAATLAADPELAAQAFYNLGNVAFRQGQLEEAVARYQRALELNPDDTDAKFNLEFTRDEIRRRLEEAKKRQEEQQQQGSEQGEQGEQQQGDQQPGANDSPSGGEPQSQASDQDQDGLPDQTERNGANPTDPANPDTDGDGLADGQEDANRNGQVDEGETDPNKADSDGDGLADGQDPQPAEGSAQGGDPSQDDPNGEEQSSEEQPAGQEGAELEGQPQPGEMTPEEAARYLAALDEGRPDAKRRGKKGRPTRPAKDW